MQASETPGTNHQDAAGPLQPIASMRHFIGLLLIGAAVVAYGLYAQLGSSGNAPSGQLAGHSVAVKIYLFAISLDWALFYYCWAGVHRRSGSLWSLAGGRWNSWRSVAVDLAIALPFWGVW